MARTTTMEEIRTRGLKALVEELGPVGMVRFLQQFEVGSGDYSKERYRRLKGLSARALAKKIQKSGSRKR